MPWSLTVLSDSESWINDHIVTLVDGWSGEGHQVTWCHQSDDLPTGELCFVLSYSRVLDAESLARHARTLVVHESDLPRGRGWSPLTWQVLEGADRIPIVLFEAVERIDAGQVYLRDEIELGGTELVDKLRARQAFQTLGLCRRFVQEYPAILKHGQPQVGDPTYFSRRAPWDSRLDPERSIAEQFDLLRVVDNERYPAWFEHRGRRYVLQIAADERPSPGQV